MYAEAVQATGGLQFSFFPVRPGSKHCSRSRSQGERGDAAWTRGILRCLKSTFISLALFALLQVHGEGVGFKKGACPRKQTTTFLPIVSSSVNHSTLEKKKNEQRETKNTFKVKENNSSRWQHGGISFKATTPTFCIVYTHNGHAATQLNLVFTRAEHQKKKKRKKENYRVKVSSPWAGTLLMCTITLHWGLLISDMLSVEQNIHDHYFPTATKLILNLEG